MSLSDLHATDDSGLVEAVGLDSFAKVEVFKYVSITFTSHCRSAMICPLHKEIGSEELEFLTFSQTHTVVAQVTFDTLYTRENLQFKSSLCSNTRGSPPPPRALTMNSREPLHDYSVEFH